MNYKKIFLDMGYKKQLTEHWLSQTNLTYNYIEHYEASPVVQGGSREHSLLFENTHFLDFFDKKLNVLVGGLTELQSSPDPSYRHLRASLYSEINYALFDNLKMTAGGQWNYFTHLEKPAIQTGTEDKATKGLVGRLALVYDITPSFGMKLFYSQAFRSASAYELDSNGTALQGDRNLRPEQIETTDAQVFYHTKDYEASFTAFRSRESNLIVRTPITASKLKIINGGSAIFEGVELETKAHFYENLHWTGAYTFQTNRDGDKQNNVTQIPNHLMKVGLSYDVTPDFQFSVFDTFASAAKVIPAAPLVNPAAKSYHHITLNAQYQLNSLLDLPFTKHVTFSFFVDNLLDVKAYYPEINRKTVINTIPANPGRSLWGELAVEF
jgi:outer membrane receptor protein involved in Fe transport